MLKYSNSISNWVWANTTRRYYFFQEDKRWMAANDATTFENVEIDLKEGELVIQAKTQIDNEIKEIEIMQEFQEESISSNGMQVSETSEGKTDNYSLYFGTLERKDKLNNAIAEERDLLEEIELGVYSEEELQKMGLPAKKIFEDESTYITTEEQFAETAIVVTNENTEEEREILLEDGEASGFVIGPGMVLTIFSRNANYRQFYEHYRAVRTGRVGIVVYSGMTLNTTVNYRKLRGDLWSTAATGAYQVARLAGGLRGGKFQPPIFERKINRGNFPHYHTWNRLGGHSFFGVASR